MAALFEVSQRAVLVEIILCDFAVITVIQVFILTSCLGALIIQRAATQRNITIGQHVAGNIVKTRNGADNVLSCGNSPSAPVRSDGYAG
ncbi:hypothetical protein D3C76_1287360 [compost metagenome]